MISANDLLKMARMAGTNNGWHLVIDTEAEKTTIPFFLRQRLQNSHDGWWLEYEMADGYGKDLRIYQASRP
ncbi:hypothetical protein GLOIN_2v1767026 [Rhizophagus irregularis DAOM 181602=DAOM 197198]|nr:hypothetical protein GLOIN_2v1767026 [Rhizophagus irregularis DAOM 181602=DAOM 197198]